MEKKNDKEIIAENERYFKFFNVLPYVVTIVFAVACFVLGIVFAAAFEAAYCIPIFWFGGAAFCVANYWVLKIVLSYRILQIYYLKKIASNSNSDAEQAEDDTDELPVI
mgnify:FL=1